MSRSTGAWQPDAQGRTCSGPRGFAATQRTSIPECRKRRLRDSSAISRRPRPPRAGLSASVRPTYGNAWIWGSSGRSVRPLFHELRMGRRSLGKYSGLKPASRLTKTSQLLSLPRGMRFHIFSTLRRCSGLTRSCCSLARSSNMHHCSAMRPSAIRKIEISWISIRRPVGSMPQNGPLCVPVDT